MKTVMTRERQQAMVDAQEARMLSGNVSDWNNTGNVSDEYDEDASDDTASTHIFTIAFGTVLILTAFTLNLRDLYKLWLRRKRWSSSHVFLFALAISDLIVAVLALPGFVVYTVSLETWPLGMNLCLLWIYVDWITTITTSAFVMVTFLSHTFMLYAPQRRHKIPGTAVMAVVLFVYANIVLLPVYVSDGLDIIRMKSAVTVCFICTYEHYQWQIVYFVCCCYGPALVVLVCCIIIKLKVVKNENVVSMAVVTLCRDENRSDKVEDGHIVHEHRDPLEHSSVVALGVVFLICWMPGYVYDLLDAYGSDFEVKSWKMLNFWLIYLCTILNPLAVHWPRLSRVYTKWRKSKSSSILALPPAWYQDSGSCSNLKRYR